MIHGSKVRKVFNNTTADRETPAQYDVVVIGGGPLLGALLAVGYALQTAGLERTTVSSAGFITGLYVVFTPLAAVVSARTMRPARATTRWRRGRASGSRWPGPPATAWPPHFPPTAKAVIQIFCPGGLSHLDTWDYKPELERRAGEALMLRLQRDRDGGLHEPCVDEGVGQLGLKAAEQARGCAGFGAERAGAGDVHRLHEVRGHGEKQDLACDAAPEQRQRCRGVLASPFGAEVGGPCGLGAQVRIAAERLRLQVQLVEVGGAVGAPGGGAQAQVGPYAPPRAERREERRRLRFDDLGAGAAPKADAVVSEAVFPARAEPGDQASGVDGAAAPCLVSRFELDERRVPVEPHARSRGCLGGGRRRAFVDGVAAQKRLRVLVAQRAVLLPGDEPRVGAREQRGVLDAHEAEHLVVG